MCFAGLTITIFIKRFSIARFPSIDRGCACLAGLFAVRPIITKLWNSFPAKLEFSTDPCDPAFRSSENLAVYCLAADPGNEPNSSSSCKYHADFAPGQAACRLRLPYQT